MERCQHFIRAALVTCDYDGWNWFGVPQNSLPKLSSNQLAGLRNGVSGLSDPCNQFLSAVFKQLGHSDKKTILGVFDEVAKKGGFYDSSPTNPSAPGYTAVGADSRTPRIELDVAGISSVSGAKGLPFVWHEPRPSLC